MSYVLSDLCTSTFSLYLCSTLPSFYFYFSFSDYVFFIFFSGYGNHLPSYYLCRPPPLPIVYHQSYSLVLIHE